VFLSVLRKGINQIEPASLLSTLKKAIKIYVNNFYIEKRDNLRGNIGCFLFLCNFTKVAGPVKATPPFLTDEVEVVVPIQPCEQYVFDVKLVSPTNSEMGTVTGIKLEKLPDIPDYIPPPITSVIQVYVVKMSIFYILMNFGLLRNKIIQ
jgi:hypothetical protein